MLSLSSKPGLWIDVAMCCFHLYHVCLFVFMIHFFFFPPFLHLSRSLFFL
jgi:hypothetical protein